MKTKLRKRVTEFMNKKSLEPMWISAIKDQNEITVQRFKELGNNGKVGFNSKMTDVACHIFRPVHADLATNMASFFIKNRIGKNFNSNILVITFETNQRHQ